MTNISLIQNDETPLIAFATDDTVSVMKFNKKKKTRRLISDEE
jgi:hypothetical protein